MKSKQRKHQTHSQQTSKSLSLLNPPTRDDTDELLIAAHRASKAKKKSKIVNTKATLNKEVITENTVHCKSSGQSDAEGEQGIFDLASLVISIAEKKVMQLIGNDCFVWEFRIFLTPILATVYI